MGRASRQGGGGGGDFQLLKKLLLDGLKCPNVQNCIQYAVFNDYSIGHFARRQSLSDFHEPPRSEGRQTHFRVGIGWDF
jgi:hypothetical protein